MQYDRTDRIAEELRRELMDLIQNTLKDPALRDQLTSIIKAEVTRDLYHAKLYMSIYADAPAQKAAIAALKRSEPVLRRELGRRMSIRRIPQLHFILDETMEHAVHIGKLIRQVETELEQSAERDGSDAP